VTIEFPTDHFLLVVLLTVSKIFNGERVPVVHVTFNDL